MKILEQQGRIELFGGLRVRQHERVVTRFRTQKTGALLSYLAYHLPQNHSREVLIERLWPESELDSGRNNLRLALSSLRRQLEPPGMPAGSVIIANRSSVRLNTVSVTTDVAEFEAALLAVTTGRAGAEQTRLLMEAVTLYRGPLLTGYYEDWITLEEQRLEGMFFKVWRQLIQTLEQEGNLERAIDYAHHALRVAPQSEEPQRELKRLYAAARGQASGAATAKPASRVRHSKKRAGKSAQVDEILLKNLVILGKNLEILERNSGILERNDEILRKNLIIKAGGTEGAWPHSLSRVQNYPGKPSCGGMSTQSQQQGANHQANF